MEIGNFFGLARKYVNGPDLISLMFPGLGSFDDLTFEIIPQEWIEGSEEVYSFLVCVVSPLKDEYEPGNPEFGFLFPAFSKRSSDENGIYIFSAKGSTSQKELIGRFIGC